MADDESSEPTEKKQKPQLFKPGQSGNPKGRPQGARGKLGEAFLQDMLAAWDAQGAAVIQKVIAEKPEQFLKVVAMILPKELHVKAEPLSDMTDDELIGILSTLRSQAARVGGSKDRSGAVPKTVN